jgi:hypothetical protein
MPKTATVPAILDLETLRDLHQHPAVAPLWAERAALIARQESTQAEFDAARAIMRLGESDDPGRFRKARRQAEQAEETLGDIRLELVDLSERLEAAQSTARYELRPLANEEALPVLEAMERALLQLQSAQEAMLGVDARLRRLGTGPSMARLADGALRARIRAVQDTLRKLRR